MQSLVEGPHRVGLQINMPPDHRQAAIFLVFRIVVGVLIMTRTLTTSKSITRLMTMDTSIPGLLKQSQM